MRFRMRSVIAAILFAVAPAHAVRVQELSVDAKSLNASGGDAKSAVKKGVAKQGVKEAKRIKASRPADLSLGKEPTEFSWSGMYGGVHAGAEGASKPEN